MLARASIWWTILSISIEERLVYRGDFALGTLMRFLPIVTQIFLWKAVFSAVEALGSGVDRVAGYSYDDFIAYYLLTMVSRAFSSMPGLASGITRDIRSGAVKKYLTQPVDLIEFLFLYRVAHKLVYYTIAVVPFAVVFYLLRSYFPGWPEGPRFAAYVISLLLAFLLGFFMEATLGLLGFWFLEISSLLFIYMLLSYFCSGHMFPLDMLPGVWGQAIKAAPFQYLAYFSSAVFLGKVTGTDLLWGLATQLGWVVTFAVAARLAFRFGVRRYSGFGG